MLKKSGKEASRVATEIQQLTCALITVTIRIFSTTATEDLLNLSPLHVKKKGMMKAIRLERNAVFKSGNLTGHKTYIRSSHTSSKIWSDESTIGVFKNISKGPRVVIVHAGGNMDFNP